MPEPMTAADCDLRDFAFMPLDCARLRDSDLAATATGDGFRAAVLLWCASWHQLPAASLPNDEKILAHLAGFGRDLKSWKRIRGEALRGFVLCDDGRLYHPHVADKANEAWESRSKFAEKREKDRERLKQWREKKQSQGDDSNDDETRFKDVPKREPNADETLKTGDSGQGTVENIPLSNDNGGKAVDQEAEFWRDAKAFLKPKVKGDPGALINKWMRDNGKELTFAALSAAQIERAFDPTAYIEGFFKRQGAKAAKQPAVPL